MCNIAAYVGTQQAAPILLDMIRKQEAFNGGYFTGIATMHEGKIYHAKLAGNTQQLIDLTEAENLPGNIGIIHSRSNAGGGDEWAHPFIGYHGDVAALAFVANGYSGIFTEREPEYTVQAEVLLNMGYKMARRMDSDGKPYQKLSDGSIVHLGDALCQQMLCYMDHGVPAVDALEMAYCKMTNEDVALAITPDNPDCIIWTRINMPMYVSFASHGAYMSSTFMALPEDATTEPQLLPACSSGSVFKNHLTIQPYKAPPARIAPLSMHNRLKAYELVCQTMREKEERFSVLSKLASRAFEGGDTGQGDPLLYEILQMLKEQGKLKIEDRIVPGAPLAPEGSQTHTYYFSL